MLIDMFLPVGQVVPVHVADGDDLGVRAAEDLGHVPVNPMVAAADQADPDALAGRCQASPAQGRCRDECGKADCRRGCRGARQEPATRDPKSAGHVRCSSTRGRVGPVPGPGMSHPALDTIARCVSSGDPPKGSGPTRPGEIRSALILLLILLLLLIFFLILILLLILLVFGAVAGPVGLHIRVGVSYED